MFILIVVSIVICIFFILRLNHISHTLNEREKILKNIPLNRQAKRGRVVHKGEFYKRKVKHIKLINN